MKDVVQFIKKRVGYDEDFFMFGVLLDRLQKDPLFTSGALKFYFDPMFGSSMKDSFAIFTHGNIPRRMLDDTFRRVNLETKEDKYYKLDDFLKKKISFSISHPTPNPLTHL